MDWPKTTAVLAPEHEVEVKSPGSDWATKGKSLRRGLDPKRSDPRVLAAVSLLAKIVHTQLVVLLTRGAKRVLIPGLSPGKGSRGGVHDFFNHFSDAKEISFFVG